MWLVLSFALYYFVLVFFSPLSIAIALLGEERANLSVFHMFIQFAIVWFCLIPLPLDVWERLRIVIMAHSGPFSYLFFKQIATKVIALIFRGNLSLSK